MIFIIYITAKIVIFLLSNNKNNKFIKKTNIFLNKSKISFENIKNKIYICKILKRLFILLFQDHNLL